MLCHLLLRYVRDPTPFSFDWLNNTQSINMKFAVTINRDEDGVWIVECPAIPGCVSQGQTKDEAVQNIQDAIHQCLQVVAEGGMPLTIETRQVDVAA
jgi:predicted RNase H-like HicB family nuclease